MNWSMHRRPLALAATALALAPAGAHAATLTGVDLSRYVRVGRYDLPEPTTTATVTSTAGSAALTVTGANLANGAFTLPQPLQANANGGTYAPVSGTPATLLTYAGPVSGDAVTLGFKQPIASTDPLRTGAYATTLTYTLSITSP